MSKLLQFDFIVFGVINCLVRKTRSRWFPVIDKNIDAMFIAVEQFWNGWWGRGAKSKLFDFQFRGQSTIVTKVIYFAWNSSNIQQTKIFEYEHLCFLVHRMLPLYFSNHLHSHCFLQLRSPERKTRKHSRLQIQKKKKKNNQQNPGHTGDNLLWILQRGISFFQFSHELL